MQLCSPVSAQRRTSKAGAIVIFFVANLRVKFRTDELHERFGTSFRTRVSELNRNPACPITIHNRTIDDASWYWAEPRHFTAETLQNSISAPVRVALERRAPTEGEIATGAAAPPSLQSTTAGTTLFGDISVDRSYRE